MSRRGADAFERLLRWYPAWWRAANGDVLLGSLLDHAEHEGRKRPSRDEALSAVVNGLAMRLDTRVALWSSVVALVLSSSVWMLGLRGAYTGVVTTGIAPVLALIGVVALIRSRGWIAPLRTLIVLAVLVGALILAALAQLSWARGFDLADAGIALAGLAAAWVPLFIGGWVVGGFGLALLLDGVLTPTRIPGFGRIAIAIIVGALAAPVLGVGLINPVMSNVVAVIVAIVALRTVERGDATPTHALRSPSRADESRRSGQRLAWFSVAGGLVGVAYALTGTAWSAGATDGTVAMGQGITIMLAASIPLLAAVGLDASKHRGRIVVWGPLCVAVVALIAVAVAYMFAPEWEGMGPWMTLSAALGGGALAWWATPRLRGPLAARVAVGIASGIAYAALIGITVIPVLAFAVPIFGVIVALRGRSGGQSKHPSAVHDGPAAPAVMA